MALLSEIIRKVFRKTKTHKASSKASTSVSNGGTKDAKKQQQQPIVEGAVIQFVMEDVTLPFVGDIKQLESMPHVNKGYVRLQNKLESGTFGEVWKGVWRQGEIDIKVAVKFFVPKYDTAKQERKILNHLQWRNTNGSNDCVVKLIGCGSFGTQEFVVLEFVEGDCLDVLCSSNKFQQDMDLTRDIFLSLARAIKSLHERKVVHRDIKAENVILCKDTRNVKLIDFGCSLLFNEKPFPAGTSPYVAPEVWKAIRTNAEEKVEREGGVHVERSDIFSFGILMWTCLTGALPFPDQSLDQIKKRVTSGDLPPMNYLHWPRSLVDIMLSCLQTSPVDRPNCCQLVQQLEQLSL